MANVLANPHKPWNWVALSANPSITWEIVKATPDKPWDWSGLSSNPVFVWDEKVLTKAAGRF
jgi:hypothetical protein